MHLQRMRNALTTGHRIHQHRRRIIRSQRKTERLRLRILHKAVTTTAGARSPRHQQENNMPPRTPEEKLHDATRSLAAANALAAKVQGRRDETIRDLFREHGYTKYRIAQLAGLSQTMIARIVKVAQP